MRATLAGRTDLAYGPHARHRIDLFPARGGRGTLVFIHGGYWRSLDKGPVLLARGPLGGGGRDGGDAQLSRTCSRSD